jgi:hypothetical protein
MHTPEYILLSRPPIKLWGIHSLKKLCSRVGKTKTIESELGILRLSSCHLAVTWHLKFQFLVAITEERWSFDIDHYLILDKENEERNAQVMW